MPEAVLAIDAGTTSVRALVVGVDGSVRGRAQTAYTLHYPAPGRIEQDAEQLWEHTRGVVTAALQDAGLSAADLSGVGITTQRSSVLVWERATGQPVAPMVSWQDLRGADRALELQADGYLVLPQTAASQVEQELDAIDGGRARMQNGELVWGNVDTFLAWRLTGGAVHLTDPSQGCATGYFDLFSGGWNEALIETQGLTTAFFPTLCDTAGELGVIPADVFGTEIPLCAIVADQQSATIAQACTAPGECKVTFGTSGTCDVNTGADIMAAQGTYPLVLARLNGTTTFCIEGMVQTAGAVFDWLAGGLGIMNSAAEAAALAATVEDSHGVFVLPAFQGLGSPYGDPTRHALIGGLTRGATRAHVVRAAMEGVAFRVREMVDRVYLDTELPRPDVLRVDGGAAANDTFMQIQADVLGQPVERMDPLEATAFGAALLAGQHVGLWGSDAATELRRVGATVNPSWSADERDARLAAWREACGLPHA